MKLRTYNDGVNDTLKAVLEKVKSEKNRADHDLFIFLEKLEKWLLRRLHTGKE